MTIDSTVSLIESSEGPSLVRFEFTSLMDPFDSLPVARDNIVAIDNRRVVRIGLGSVPRPWERHEGTKA